MPTGVEDLNGAAQIYGGFTIPQIDEILAKYAHKSLEVYTKNIYQRVLKTIWRNLE